MARAGSQVSRAVAGGELLNGPPTSCRHSARPKSGTRSMGLKRATLWSWAYRNHSSPRSKSTAAALP